MCPWNIIIGFCRLSEASEQAPLHEVKDNLLRIKTESLSEKPQPGNVELELNVPKKYS